MLFFLSNCAMQMQCNGKRDNILNGEKVRVPKVLSCLWEGYMYSFPPDGHPL